MRIKVVLFLSLVSGLVFLSIRHAVRNPAPLVASPASSQTASSQSNLKVGTSAGSPGPQKADAQASEQTPPSRQALWDQPVAEPQFAAFKNWVGRYQQAASADAKAALEEEGVTLARARLTAMADLIQSNPERALALVVPEGVRRELPGSINALLEEEVNARGEFQVLAVKPGPDSAVTLPPVVRAAVINGEQHEVFTYGAALGYVTKQNVPMSGVAVPLDAASTPPTHRLIQRTKLMALREYPIRILEKKEFTELLAKKPLCSISGLPGVVGAAPVPSAPLGDLTHEAAGPVPEMFCGPAHLKQWAASANAGLSTPDGAAFPTAESSYTEGRKRMLLMRPVWSNYTGGMTTNDALTHFQNFSNYMFEMSYGKLVLAPLGKGSEVTPPMTLPGLVADYDNTGLGLLYNNCRTAASTTYGYNLADFDFTYVCTAGAPAASYAGLAFVGGVGFHMANSYWGADVTCHEFGHNLGLNHAHFWDTSSRSIIGDGQNVEYGDNNDPMGGGGSPNTYNSRYKNYLGWIHDTDVADLNVTGSGTYRLYCFDLDTSVGLRGLKFTHNASQNYWLNFRQRKTTKKALMNGVQLLWTGNGNEGSFLLDVRLKGDADDNAIVIGRTFSDSALGFHVTPVRKGHTFPESMDVQVNIGSFPGNQSPSVLASASPAVANPGQAVTFTAAASDPNGDTLAYSWNFGDGDYSVDNGAVTTHSFASAGEYAVQCTASDMKGGAARHTVIVRVGNPAIFRVSGHVLDQQNRPMSGIRVSTSSGVTAYTDSDGNYTIPGLAAGSYDLTAIEPVTGGFTFVHPAFVNPVTVGPSRTATDFVGVPGTLDIYTPLVAKASSPWRYLDNGTDQGTAWRAPGFVDTTWGSGTAPLGYPSGSPITTVIGFGPDANNKYITYYFRRAFNVSDPNAYTNLLLEVLRDDSAAVYLNGNEVFRNNLPAGTLTYTTRAVDNSGASSYLSATLSRSLLVPGVNYLAAEVHQVLPTSSDVVFDAALSGLSVSNATGFKYLYVSSPANNASFTNPPNILITATAFSGAGPVSLVEFFADGVKLGEDSAPPYGINWSSPLAGSHILTTVATISGSGSLTSAPVSITVFSSPVLSVQLASPVDASSFTVPATVNLSATVVAGAAAVTSVQFFANGELLGEDTSAPFSAALTRNFPDSLQLIAVAADAASNSSTSAPVNITFTQPSVGTQLISFGEAWKYLDNGTDQGTGWRVPGFDDRLWAAGPARLGYGGDGEITILSFGPNVNQRYITTYFRKTFTVANPAAFTGLLLRLMRDDGAVVYLNGVEVFRDNLLSGPVNWNSLASVSIDGPAETTPLEVNLGTGNLVPGNNVLAVEIHQVAINNADLGFDLSLAGLQSAGSPQDIYLTQPADGAHFNGPTNINLAAYINAPGVDSPVVQFFADDTFLGTGSSGAPFSFIWSNAPLGSHQLVAVFAAGNFSTSAPVNIVVGTAPPRIQPLTANLISAGLNWRYWDNVAPVGGGWQTRDFNDSAWPVGTARFGWGLDGEITTLTEGRVTHYFRKWFTISQPALLTELLFQLARDDGAVVYLNGVEIFRSNMPGGPVTAITLAATTINPPDETIYEQHLLRTAGSGIVAGTNLVAVELHQSAATSSDASFDLQLTGYGTTEARVYLTTPADGASFSVSQIINLEAIAKGSGAASATNVEFFANGLKIAESGAAPWRFAWSNAPLGLVSLTARGTDNTGAVTESVPIQIAIGRELVSTTFISSNSVWKYLDNGSNQGTNWTLRGYNDAAWKTGVTRLGYGGDGETLPAVSFGPNANNKYITTYFRRAFVVQPGAIYTNLLFKLVRDDGAVVYFNGVEAFRSNMPPGPVNYSTLAFAADDEQSFYPTSISITNLPAGTNLVAVEVHQTSVTSSDIGFNLELTASGYEDAAAPPLLTITLADGQVELRWSATAVGWQVYVAPAIDTPANAWTLAVGTLVQVGGQHVFTIAPGGGNEFFRLRKP